MQNATRSFFPVQVISSKKSEHNRWKKQGLVIRPDPSKPWMVTHAMLPFADPIGGDLYRVYFSGRDRENRSWVSYVDARIGTSSLEIVKWAPAPALGLGALGSFDDNGVTPSWVVTVNGKKYLYYIGWNKGSTVRMGLLAGLAVSDDGGQTFRRVSRAPILERNDLEPYALNTAPCVRYERGLWRMWYVSGVEWIHPNLPRYNIKYAESDDGAVWRRDGRVCIDFKSPEEYALARPCVRLEDGIYKMWYSYKGENYRIGYAESRDGISWSHKDNAIKIEGSSSGWDSRMQEYAFVFCHKKRKYMLYNGNDYGKEGIGLAVEEREG